MNFLCTTCNKKLGGGGFEYKEKNNCAMQNIDNYVEFLFTVHMVLYKSCRHMSVHICTKKMLLCQELSILQFLNKSEINSLY